MNRQGERVSVGPGYGTGNLVVPPKSRNDFPGTLSERRVLVGHVGLGRLVVVLLPIPLRLLLGPRFQVVETPTYDRPPISWSSR